MKNIIFKSLLINVIIFNMLYVSVIYGASDYCQNKKYSDKECSNNLRLKSEIEKNEVWITIWVHGIMGLTPHINWTNVLNFATDCIEGTFYEAAVKYIRRDQFFCHNQPMQGLGLMPVDKNSEFAGDSSAALAILFDYLDAKTKGRKPKNNYYYTFGWSGLLSKSVRFQEAKKFYVALANLVKEFRSHGINPKIRIYGYSHAGGILLALAAGRQEKLSDIEFCIDEIILLGSPIQTNTDFYVNDPLFKKIYNVYSLSDRIQALDPFTGDGFSSRYFRKRKDLILPNKLVQIELRLFRNVRSSYYYPKFLDPRYNVENNAVLSGHLGLLRNASPGHGEWWFFGWTHSLYRTDYAIEPLSIVSIMPYVLDNVQKFEEEVQPNPCRHIVADIRPDQEMLIIRTKHHYDDKMVVPFLSYEGMEEMKDKAREYAFKRVTKQDYNEHIQRAFKKAEAEMPLTKCPVHTKKRLSRFRRKNCICTCAQLKKSKSP